MKSRPSADENESICNELATRARYASRASVILSRAPDNRPENAAPIKRETRNKIEKREPKIDEREPGCERAQRLAVGENQSQTLEHEVQQETCQRAGDGDVEFLDRLRGFAANPRHPAENKECDGDHPDLVALRYDTVRELVE